MAASNGVAENTSSCIFFFFLFFVCISESCSVGRSRDVVFAKHRFAIFSLSISFFYFRPFSCTKKKNRVRSSKIKKNRKKKHAVKFCYVFSRVMECECGMTLYLSFLVFLMLVLIYRMQYVSREKYCISLHIPQFPRAVSFHAIYYNIYQRWGSIFHIRKDQIIKYNVHVGLTYFQGCNTLHIIHKLIIPSAIHDITVTLVYIPFFSNKTDRELNLGGQVCPRNIC